MTTAQIAKDAYAMMKMTTHRPLRTPVSDPKIATMDAIEISGIYDRDDNNLRRSRQGAVGDSVMTCQVAVLDDDVLLVFYSLEDGHQRRVLVTVTGAVWMETGRGAAVVIGPNNKYFQVVQAVLAARAH